MRMSCHVFYTTMLRFYSLHWVKLALYPVFQAVQQDDNGGDSVNCLWSLTWCPGRKRREIVWSRYWGLCWFLSWSRQSNITLKDFSVSDLWACISMALLDVFIYNGVLKFTFSLRSNSEMGMLNCQQEKQRSKQ